MVGLNTSYRVASNIELYGYIETPSTNYATFGTFSPVNEVPIVRVPNATSNRSLAPVRRWRPSAACASCSSRRRPPPWWSRSRWSGRAERS